MIKEIAKYALEGMYPGEDTYQETKTLAKEALKLAGLNDLEIKKVKEVILTDETLLPGVIGAIAVAGFEVGAPIIGKAQDMGLKLKKEQKK